MTRVRVSAAAVLGLTLVFVAAGCSRTPTGPAKPKVDAADAARAAVAKYDVNGDGKLDAKELKKCPGLLDALKRADANGDNMLDEAEIAARIEKWFAGNAAIVDALTQVTLDGKNLEGATVTYEPEEFLGPAFKPVSGTTDAHGQASPTGADPNPKFNGLYPGVYRVKISKEVGGKEIVPKQYNAETELGKEIAPDGPRGTIEFHLKSR
jgi:uncharacterized protein (DUF2141 family)